MFSPLRVLLFFLHNAIFNIVILIISYLYTTDPFSLLDTIKLYISYIYSHKMNTKSVINYNL